MQIAVPDDLRDFLLEKAALYERPDFIPDDPIAVLHRFSDKADIELAGFIGDLAWGNARRSWPVLGPSWTGWMEPLVTS